MTSPRTDPQPGAVIDAWHTFREAIAASAYERWEAGGPQLGRHLQDWVDAEADLIQAKSAGRQRDEHRRMEEHVVTQTLAESADIVGRQREFDLARRIQQRLLPRCMPELPGFTFAGASEFAQETGGDYYDFFPVAESNLGIALGDASGHGIGAAFIMAEARASLRALAQTHSDPAKLLALTNRCLSSDLPDDQFVTLFLARLNPVTRSLAYSNAGHCHGYVLDKRGDVRLVLKSTSMPLGVNSQAEFPNGSTVTLRANELVFLFSDGLVEATSPQGLPFGIARALEAVRANRHVTPNETVQAVFRAVRDYSCGQVLTDDVTVVIIKVEPDG